MAIAVTIHTSNQTVDAGAVVTLDATISGFSADDAYDWREDGFSLPFAGVFSNFSGGIVNADSGDGTWTAPSPAVQTTYVLSLHVGSVSDSVSITVRAGTIVAPGVPTGVSLTQISGDSDSLRAAWNAVTGATSYQGQYKKTSDSGWTPISGNITSPHQINGLDADTSHDFRVRATNSGGSSNYSSADSATTAAEAVTPDPVGWSSPTRLDSIADLDTIFDRADTGSSGGAWTLDTSGSTTSSNTGPGTNSGAPYVYSETSSGSFSTIPVKSTLTVKSAVMTAWTGADRQMLLRASIQGAFSATEGLEVEGRALDSDDWTRIELLEGWAYSDFYVSGGTVTDAAGDTQTFSQVGGWIDFAVTIPDAYTQVRIHTLAISGGNFYEHDIALWRIELLDGTAGPPPVPTGLAASVTAITDSGTTTTVTWNASSGATKYELQVWDDATQQFYNLSSTITATTYAYTDAGQSGTYHGRSFSFFVRAGNDDGQWSLFTALADAAHIVIPMASPTVTAVDHDSISEAAAEGRGVDLAEVSDRGRDGATGARIPGHIGFASIRGGDMVGEHDVIFAGAGERLILRHVATDRALYAKGALAAALWGLDKKPGEYDMNDVLGI